MAYRKMRTCAGAWLHFILLPKNSAAIFLFSSTCYSCYSSASWVRACVCVLFSAHGAFYCKCTCVWVRVFSSALAHCVYVCLCVYVYVFFSAYCAFCMRVFFSGLGFCLTSAASSVVNRRPTLGVPRFLKKYRKLAVFGVKVYKLKKLRTKIHFRNDINFIVFNIKFGDKKSCTP